MGDPTGEEGERETATRGRSRKEEGVKGRFDSYFGPRGEKKATVSGALPPGKVADHVFPI